MITLFQIDGRMVRRSADATDAYMDATAPTSSPEGKAKAASAILALIAAGAYRKVAVIEGTDLDDAYEHTQNSPYLPSWSMLPHASVTPEGLGYTMEMIGVERAAQMRREASMYREHMSKADHALDAKRASLTTLVTEKGQDYECQPYGYKSTSMGDLFVVDGKVSVVASFGFDVIGEQRLADALEQLSAA